MLDKDGFENALLEGTAEVFETMMFMTVEKCVDQGIDGEAILSSITFKGDAMEGCVAFCCNEQTASTIAVNMLGMEPGEEVSPEEAYDAMGEVSNMVMGAFKTRIAEAVGDVQVSIPSVVKGMNLENSLGEGSEDIYTTVFVDEEVASLTLKYRLVS